MLLSLEKENLIIRKNDPTDGRGKLIEIRIAKKVMAEMYEKLYLNVNGHKPTVQ